MQLLLLDGSKRVSAPHNRHSLRGLVQANSMRCPQRASPSNNASISAWGQHIESSCLMWSSRSCRAMYAELDVATDFYVLARHDSEARRPCSTVRLKQEILFEED